MLVHYRDLHPTDGARRDFEAWLEELEERIVSGREDRNEVVRDTLEQIYAPAGLPYGARPVPNEAASNLAVPLVKRALAHCFDPRNVTLEAEYYSDVDAARYAERKPLLWLWLMFDRSPLGLNHWLGFRLRRLLARHVFRHCGANVKIFHGVEVSFGYNITVEDDCVIHRYVLLDDRGEIVIRRGSSVSDYANIYSHAHDVVNSLDVTSSRTELGTGSRVTYHATVLSGVKVGADAMIGSLAVATKDVPDHHVVGGIPAKTLRVKPTRA